MITFSQVLLISFVLALLNQVTPCSSQISNCSGSLQNVTATDGGAIVSHDGVGVTNYSNSMRCYWQIGAPFGYRVVVWFTYLEIEPGNDRVLLFDGVNGSALIATVNVTASTGYVSPQYVSSSNVMTVNFYTSDSDTRRGFRLLYRVTTSPPNNICRPVSYTNSSNISGIVTSHDSFGSAPYSPNVNCSWTFPALSGKYIQLTVSNLSLGDGDCLALVTGSAPRGSPSTTYCGWVAKLDLSFQMGGNVRVDFTSSAKFESTGFFIRAEYSSFCPNQNLSVNDSGEIVSHIGAGATSYWNNMNCNWYISAPVGRQLVFWFTVFQTYNNGLNYATVWDIGNGGTQLVNAAGTVSSSNVYETVSNLIRVNFVTDASSTGVGFRLQYNVTQLYCFGFQNVTSGSGELRSHLRVATNYYLNNMDCIWQLNAPLGSRVVAWFTFVTMYNSDDNIRIYDGVNGTAQMALVYTSGYNGYRFVSTANTMTIYFHTDSIYPYGTGFQLQYSTIGNAASKTCGRISFTNSSNMTGSFVSHDGYGSTLYSSSVSCVWTLPQRPGYYIYLIVSEINLGSGDCIWLSNNAPLGSTPNASYCGPTYYLSRSMVTPGDAIISFNSDSAIESLGFTARFEYAYSCVNIQVWSADTGEISSHSGVERVQYMNNVNCNWQISVSPGKKVIAWFTYISLNDYYDVVTLYDGMTGTNTVGTFRGATSGYQGYVSTSNFMRVNFATDSNGNGFGFRLQYSVTDRYCSPNSQGLTGSGEIMSHRDVGVNSCLKNLNCYWQILAPPANVVMVRFTFFSVDASYDQLNLLDGISGNTVATPRGSSGNATWIYISPSNSIRVYFSSTVNSRVDLLGFRMEYNTSESFCRGFNYLSGEAGELTSHNAVGSRAITVAGSTCYWTITVPTDKRILIWFTYFNLNYPDYLNIFDGILTSAMPISLTYGSTPSQINSIYMSTSNTLSVQFHSSSGTSLGFRMSYNATDAFCQRYQLVQGGSGQIASHSGAGTTQYLNNMACTWQIVADPGKQIAMSLVFLDLSTASDTVTLLDGTGETQIIVLRGGAAAGPTNFLTLSNILTVRFGTDSSGTGLGFRLQYNTGSDPPSSTPASTLPATAPTTLPTTTMTTTTTTTTTTTATTKASPATTAAELSNQTTGGSLQKDPGAQSLTMTIVVATVVPAVVLILGAVIAYLAVKSCRTQAVPPAPTPIVQPPLPQHPKPAPRPLPQPVRNPYMENVGGSNTNGSEYLGANGAEMRQAATAAAADADTEYDYLNAKLGDAKV